MENLKFIKFEQQDGVAILTFDRPKVNGIDLESITEFRQALHHCRYTDSIRCVIFTAAGPFFSVGGDVQAMFEAGDKAGLLIRKMADEFHRGLSIMMRMEKPVINAINGLAAGGGMSLAITGDIVIAAESAKFTLAYTNAGLTPDGSSTYMLPRLIGLRRTVELALTNRTLSAQEALEWNMITQVVPDDQLMDTALDLAKKLAHGPTDAYAHIKKLMLMTYSNSLEEQTDFEKEGIAHQLDSYNGQEGIRAFMEKRKPKFK